MKSPVLALRQMLAWRSLCRASGALILAIVGWTTSLPAAEPATPYGNNPAAGHFAELNGIKLYYEVYGVGAPLVVLHGNGGDISDMRYQIGYFSTDREVIAIDSRGCGRSEMGSGRLTYVQMAEDVAALLVKLHPGPVDVIGWSDGGIVALLLALHHPAEVHRLAVSGVNLSPAAFTPADLAAMTADLHTAEMKLATRDQSRPWMVTYQNLQLMITQPDITRADLAKIKAPTLLLAGEHDIFPEAYTRSIATGLPHAQVHIFTGASHGALQEVPDAFNAIVAEFFRTQP